MNIIEAIQAAENGKLITGGIRKKMSHFLKYMGAGVFYQYSMIDNKPYFKYQVSEFTMLDIITIDWEIVEGKYF